MPFNSDNFDLTNWKLTLPVDKSGLISGNAHEPKNLLGFESAQHFYDAPDGAMVFRASADGATTSGSKYARSELREMDGSRLAAWNLNQGGTMTATLEVDAVPNRADGSPGRLIIGQIHGEDEELIRLYWENGTIYYMNDQAGSSNSEMRFNFQSTAGAAPQISLNERFSYKIDARGDTLRVEVFSDGQVFTSVAKINSVWQSDTFYFKAGVYLGVNESNGAGSGQASFYGLDVGHTPGEGLGGWKVGMTPSSPLPVPTPVEDTILGNAGNNSLNGTSGTDIVSALGGNDTIYGGRGADVITTGSGIDTLVYKAADEGSDTITDFSSSDRIDLNAIFQEITGFKATEAFEAGYVRVVSQGNDVQLWVDTDGAKGPAAATHIGTFTNAKLGDFGLDSFVLSNGPTAPNAPTTPLPSPSAPSKSMSGNDENNTITGGLGRDVIRGNGGNDVIFGGLGDDVLWGNSGADTIIGGAGSDWIKGGDGLDRYVFQSLGDAGDTISDYRKGEKIDISGITDDFSVSDNASYDELRDLGFISIRDTGHDTNSLFVDYDGFAGPGAEVMVVKIVGIDDWVRDGNSIIV